MAERDAAEQGGTAAVVSEVVGTVEGGNLALVGAEAGDEDEHAVTAAKKAIPVTTRHGLHLILEVTQESMQPCLLAARFKRSE